MTQVATSAAVMYDKWDDFSVVSGHLEHSAELTLLTVVKNEMYYLPAFLKHYRRLGISRFLVLDDNSNDGTRKYLSAQTDTVVLSSNRSYGDIVSFRPPTQRRDTFLRIGNIWRNLLLERFGTGNWVILADADEFLRLPDGLTLPALLSRVDNQCPHAQVIWSVLLDLYPEHISDLESSSSAQTLDRSATWHFDGQPHLRMRGNHKPRAIYHGSRARLLYSHDVLSRTAAAATDTVLRLLLRKTVRLYNLIWKPTLLKRPSDGILLNSHNTNFTHSANLCLPLEHYKFTSQVFARAAQAIGSRSHHNSSQEYVHIRDLLNNMAQNRNSFLTSSSTPVGSFEIYLDTGVVVDEAGILGS